MGIHNSLDGDEIPILYEHVNAINDFINTLGIEPMIRHLALQTLLVENCIENGYRPMAFAEDLVALQSHYNKRYEMKPPEKLSEE